ncbi:MAG: DUF2029 domain-containing protein [Chloroflexi bacterium]|nr:DUF2029 domain-containing protein [Chloroflexota bacterium]
MPFKDIDIFVSAAAAILQGSDPYALTNFEVFYPLPFFFLFIPFVPLPPSVVHAVWTGLQVVILVVVLRRRALIAVWSIPVLATLLFGQAGIVMLGLFTRLRNSRAGGVALAFIALKPILVLLLVPWMLWQWWQRDRRQIVWFVVVLGVLILGSFVVQPDWVVRFLARTGERARVGIVASLWGWLAVFPAPTWLLSAVLVTVGLVIWAWRQNDFDCIATVGFLINPFIFSYDLLLLLDVLRKQTYVIGFVVISWFAFAISAMQSNDRAGALLTLATLGVLLWGKRTTNRGKVIVRDG